MSSLDMQILLLLFDTILLMPIFLVSSFLFLKFIDLISSRAGTLLRYLAYPGIILHRVYQDLMGYITGIPVVNHQITVKKDEVKEVIDVNQINSFLGSVVVSLAPLFLLSLTLNFLLVFSSIAPQPNLFTFYFCFCCFIGLTGNGNNFSLIFYIARRDLRRLLVELGLLLIPFSLAFGYLLLRATFSFTFSIWHLGIIFAIGVLIAYSIWLQVKSHQHLDSRADPQFHFSQSEVKEVTNEVVPDPQVNRVCLSPEINLLDNEGGFVFTYTLRTKNDEEG